MLRASMPSQPVSSKRRVGPMLVVAAATLVPSKLALAGGAMIVVAVAAQSIAAPRRA